MSHLALEPRPASVTSAVSVNGTGRSGAVAQDKLRRALGVARMALSATFLLAMGAIGGSGCGCGPEPVDGGPDCTAGTLDCVCAATGDACGTNLACVDDVCGTCEFGTNGCPCLSDDTCTDSADVCDQDDSACRPASACESAGCAQFQLCEQAAGEDAVCIEDCETGYDWNGINCTAIPSCDAADPGFVDCGDDRGCSVVAGAVVCGDCDPGFVDVNGVCIENDCDAVCGVGRECSSVDTDGGPPVCGDCAPGFIEDVAAGTCVDRITCSDLVATDPCDTDEVCLEATPTTDARCAAEANCEVGFVASPVSGNCSQCVNCYDHASGTPVAFDGVIGIGNLGYSSQEKCVCELSAGYFQSQDDGRVKQCDADNDGWANADLEEILDTENPFATEQQCDVRRVDGFVLRADDYQDFVIGGQPTLAASKFVSISDLQIRFGLPDTGIRTDANGVQFIDLYEREELDIEVEFQKRYQDDQNDLQRLHLYGQPADPTPVDGGVIVDGGAPVVGAEADHYLISGEANSLTKMCNHSRDDLNRDSVADVNQGHGNVPAGDSIASGPGIPNAMGVYYRMAYFIELNRGFFIDNGCVGESTCHGRYVIQEKSRVELGTETGLDFNYTATESGYWQMCARSRDAAFPGRNASGVVDNNFDFGEWHDECEAETGRCVRPDGTVHYDGRELVTVGDIENPPPDLSNGAARFPGMNHHSQFKCVTFQNAHVVAPPADALTNRQLPAGDYVLQDCAIAPHDPRGVPGEDAVNPRDPPLTCNSVDSTSAAAQAIRLRAVEQNYFIARKQSAYRNDPVSARPVDFETSYPGGCIDENSEWTRFCFVDSEIQSLPNFGELFCGCGPNRTGVRCEIGCPDDNLFSDRAAVNGALEGYWMCARPTASEVQTLTGGNYSLRGEVPAVVTPTTPLCEESDGGPNCDVGYSIHPYTIR